MNEGGGKVSKEEGRREGKEGQRGRTESLLTSFFGFDVEDVAHSGC